MKFYDILEPLPYAAPVEELDAEPRLNQARALHATLWRVMPGCAGVSLTLDADARVESIEYANQAMMNHLAGNKLK